MSALDRATLRALAKAATPGPWEAEGDYKSPDIIAGDLVVAVTIASDMKPPVNKANAEFIAAANPAAVLALLDEVARLRDLLGRVLASLETHIPYAPWHMRQALDDDGNLIVDEGSLVAEARAALGKEPRA